MHTLYLDIMPAPHEPAVTIRGEEARHAIRVKRLSEGATVRLVDGMGHVCLARVAAARRDLELTLLDRSTETPPTPAIECCTATPKGPRLDKMIDQLSQIGAAAWRPMATALGVVDPGAGKLERLNRIAVESAKQSGRAWLLRIDSPMTFSDALTAVPGLVVAVADPSGDPYPPTGAEKIRLLIGPEGGFTEDERATARAAGARLVSLGPHILRIETAAAVAAAIILHEESRPQPSP